MGNYFYDDYEAKMKVTNDIINDNNFYQKLKQNFVSPKKIFEFVQVIFATFKCPPYHTKFLQLFYNNLNILERDEYFVIVQELYKDLTINKLTFHESFNNFNGKLCDIKAKNPDKSIFNYGLVKPKKDALDHFFLYVNYHRNEFEKIKSQIKLIVKEVNAYPSKLDSDPSIHKITTEEHFDNKNVEICYIGNINNGKKEGKGMLITKNKSNNEIISIYIGEFIDDKKNGLGLIKKKEEQIEGSFMNDKPEGKIGIYQEKQKIYVEYKNGKKNGREIILSDDGTIITKENKDDVFNETISIFRNGVFFTGKITSQNIYQGIIYEAEEGKVYVGTFDENLNLNGEGYQYRNGSSIYGTYYKGNFVPSLCYYCKSNGYLSYGYCNENGDLHGKDILTLIYSNNEFKGDLYISDYINGEQTKKREYYWGNGGYEKVMENGWGMRYCKDNETIFEGIMINGFPRGFGYLSYKGTKYTGNYDLNNARCLFISNDNKAYRCRITHDDRFNTATATQYKTEVHN